MKELVLVGGGGHCRSVIEAAESAGRKIHCILDTPEYTGSYVLGHLVAGTDDEIESLAGDYEFIVTVGFIKSASLRRRLHKRIERAGVKLATVIASTAYVSRYASIGSGTVVLHHATVNAGATVGPEVILNTGCIVEHDVIIGRGSHISTGAIVNGGCEIGEEVFLGSNSVVNQGVKITSGVIVASGSVVRHDIDKPGIFIDGKLKEL